MARYRRSLANLRFILGIICLLGAEQCLSHANAPLSIILSNRSNESERYTAAKACPAFVFEFLMELAHLVDG